VENAENDGQDTRPFTPLEKADAGNDARQGEDQEECRQRGYEVMDPNAVEAAE